MKLKIHDEVHPGTPGMGGSLWLLLAGLYCAQGLPSGIIAHGLPALLRSYQVDLVTISVVKLLALPWALKFLWAPWVDSYWWPKLGQTRSWALPTIGGVIVFLWILALKDAQWWFEGHLGGLFILLFLINLLAATQDIATDSLAVRSLTERWRGIGNAVQVIGYKFGMVIGGALWLIGIDHFGWYPATVALVFALLLIWCGVWFYRNQTMDQALTTDSDTTEKVNVWRSWREQFVFLLAQPTSRLWLLILVIYKAGDSLGSGMIKPMMIDQGFGLSVIGELTLWGMVAGLVGALMGGLLMLRVRTVWCLLALGILQAVGIGLYGWIAQGTVSETVLWLIVLLEQFADGASTVVLFACMMAHCRPGHEGADYTLQASVQVVSAGVFAMLGGLLAQTLGYFPLFMVAAVLGFAFIIPALRFFNRADWDIHSDFTVRHSSTS